MKLSNNVKAEDNTEQVLAEFKKACNRALEECGLDGEKYAKNLCPVGTSGHLRTSITHSVDESSKTCYIGTNTEYAPYVELGTGIYCTLGGGRMGWWVYVPDSESTHKNSGKVYTYDQAKQVVAMMRSKDIDAHMTQGQKAQPYLKPAVADHAADYKWDIERQLKNG